MSYRIYQALATKYASYLSWLDTNMDRANIFGDEIERPVKNKFPSGSGFDSGTTFNFEESKKDKLVFDTSFHHMNEHGFYDGMTEHKVIVTPSWHSFDIKVTGRDRNQIKEYIADCFYSVLNEEYSATML